MAGFLDSLKDIKWFDDKLPNGAMAAPQDLGAIHKFGLVLQNISDPTTLPRYNAEYKEDQIFQREMANKSALKQLSQDPNFATLNPAQQLQQIASITGDLVPLAQYNADQQITPYQQAQLGLERERIAAANANNTKYQFIQNPDGSISVGNPRTGKLGQLTQSPIFNSGLQAGQGTTLPNGTTVTLDERGKPLYGVSPVQGYTPVSGAVPTSDDAKAVKAATMSAKQLLGPNGLLARYEKAVQEYGSEFGGKGGQLLEGLKTDINLRLKDVNELGALAGPDQSILDAQLYDPTTIGANFRGAFLPASLGIATSPRQLARQSSQRLRETVTNNLNAGLEAVGYRPNSPNPDWSIKKVK